MVALRIQMTRSNWLENKCMNISILNDQKLGRNTPVLSCEDVLVAWLNNQPEAVTNDYYYYDYRPVCRADSKIANADDAAVVLWSIELNKYDKHHSLL